MATFRNILCTPSGNNGTIVWPSDNLTFDNASIDLAPTLLTIAPASSGTMDGVVIGGTTAVQGTFTTITTTGNIELGHASDTTISRVSAGVVAVEGVNLVNVSATQTLTNKTLTSPKFADLGFIADANGNELIVFDTVTSAVNEVTLANAATGNLPTFTASGGDASVGISFVAKGDGEFQFHAKNENPYVCRFYNDTYSSTVPGFQYFIYNNGNFAMGTPGSKNIDIFTNAFANTRLRIASTGEVIIYSSLQLPKTITAAATTGAQTINKASGSVNFAASDTSLVVTNSLVTTSSVIICTVGTNDTTMKSVAAVAAAGSFTMHANAAAAAETRVNFLVIN